MFWIFCGLVAAALYIYTAYKQNHEVTALDMLIAFVIGLLGVISLIIAALILVFTPEEFGWSDKLKSFIIFDDD